VGCEPARGAARTDLELGLGAAGAEGQDGAVLKVVGQHLPPSVEGEKRLMVGRGAIVAMSNEQQWGGGEGRGDREA